MAEFKKLTLTKQGEEALLKAVAGEATLKFTKITMGSGYAPEDILSLIADNLSLPITALYQEEASVMITEGAINKENYTYTVVGRFNNETITKGFEWREVGLWIEGSDGKDVLYGYANAGDRVDYISATTDTRFIKYLRITTAIRTAPNVCIASYDGDFITRPEFEEFKVTVNTKLDEILERLPIFTPIT